MVVVENVLTIPVNLPASRAVAAALRGRPALLHHHDPPVAAAVAGLHHRAPRRRPVLASRRHQPLHARRVRGAGHRGRRRSTTGSTPTHRSATAPVTGRRLGVADGEPLLLHPVRAIERKNVPGALALAEATGGTYWLPGPAEDGYGPTLDALLASTRTTRPAPSPRPRRRPRRLRRVRRRAVPVDLGGLRQPSDRSRHPPQAGRGRPLPGRRRAPHPRLPVAGARSPRRPGRGAGHRPTTPRSTTTTPWSASTARSTPCATTWPACWPPRPGCHEGSAVSGSPAERPGRSRPEPGAGPARPTTPSGPGAARSPAGRCSRTASGTCASAWPSPCSSFGFAIGFTPATVSVVVVAMVVGSVLLAPAIVLGYAVKAAEREDLEHGR